jgi:hypothetical protein
MSNSIHPFFVSSDATSTWLCEVEITSKKKKPKLDLSAKWHGRSQVLLCLKRGSATARCLGLRVRITSGTWISVSCECWVFVRYRFLRRADHSSRGVLLSVWCVCLSVIEKPHTIGLGPIRPSRHEKKGTVQKAYPVSPIAPHSQPP